MAQSLSPEGFLFQGFGPKSGAEDEEALFFRRQGAPAPPRRRREYFSKARRLLACGVPNTRLAEVHIDVCVAFERRAQGDERGACVRWVACRIRIIQERTKVGMWPEFGVRRQRGQWMPTANRPGMRGSPCSLCKYASQ